MKTIAVLGTGRVGATIARDLATQFNVIAVDSNETSLASLKDDRNIICTCTNITSPGELANVIKDASLVVNALPGFLGYQILKSIIENGKHAVDISFFPEDALTLNKVAQEKKVTAIVDMGVAPGMNNLLLGYHDQHMKINKFSCYVGGLPKYPEPPFYYKAPFSPADVLEEYTRPARLMEHGNIITKPALSEIEIIHFENIGALEAFNTDGLRTLLSTKAHIPNMVEKTLRYPGHIEVIAMLKNMGFLDNMPLKQLRDNQTALALTAKILTDQWQLKPGEPEFTVMRVHIDGEEDGKTVRYQYTLYDEYDSVKKNTSMARTTGYACNAAVHLLAQGKVDDYGIIPPETLAQRDANVDFVMQYLKQRKVLYHKIRSTH